MRLSQSLFQTLREAPKDADIVSQKLMMRAGLLKKHAPGIFSMMPLMVRSYHKVCQIIREEFDRIGWQEVAMPFVIPGELWKETGRWQEYGDLMARFQDRKKADYCLGPTHEEVVTDIVRHHVQSYRQLPVTLYQISSKFRDEIRPRFGIMRGREFVMLDGYSFHCDTNDLDRHYEVVAEAYRKIFSRCGLQVVAVEADTGDMGGTGSHEFQVLADAGEDLVAVSGSYAANIERAETPPPQLQDLNWGQITTQPLTLVDTPENKTIEAVSAQLKIPPHRCVKTLVFEFNTHQNPQVWTPVSIFISGHRELNDVKLRQTLKRIGHSVLNLIAMSPEKVERLYQAPVGFLGPIPAPPNGVVLYDREVAAIHDGVCGANQINTHWIHVEPSRDFPNWPKQSSPDSLPDLVQVKSGDRFPGSDGHYLLKRGIEVGHIFKLGTRYSQAMNAIVQSPNNKETNPIVMGCYGIGVTRLIAAAIEQSHDTDGIVWPTPIAPFQLHFVSLGNDPEIMALSETLYSKLKELSVDVVWDDRDLSPGVKFKDCDLLGLPFRLAIGKKGLENGQMEWSLRSNRERELIGFQRDQIDAFVQTIVSRMRSG